MHKELVATSPNRLSGEIKLSEKVANVYSGIINYLGKPTDSQIQRLNLLEGVYSDYRKELDSILSDKIPGLNSQLKDSGLEEIKFISREDYDKN
jgi:hypothetical protein